MYWYKKVVFENYANFNGRARRTEYWYFTLFNIIFTSILKILDSLLFDDIEIIGSIYGLAIFIPGLAVSVRRFHDIGKSGWQLLIAYVLVIAIAGLMIIGSFAGIDDGISEWIIIPAGLILVIAVWLLVMFCTEGDNFTNKYGPNPKADDDEINQIGMKE
ncbi:DUF805 domain-containing protein [Flavobacterium dankookense]|uniref:Uncharacterized membrane protein YhaH (DUF805 family) n=1 Tax=Flavobacterium dankookense TaxID=706186 RepID=A0A4R6QBA7_9FLAO|nr:DUF805 domain-containing protein [Flavobacterium dankookense]TDP59974.1 uncharacterized membrane protein YhaH (DUF805 family) [Flavobacterium dankookense]